MVKLSVIIPIYNTAEYLEECLNSIINQTYKDIEIICVDDGSTDNCLEILNIYAQKDDRIKILTQENKGQAAARNKALSIVTGDYITFVDSDDYLLPNAYEKAMNSIEKADIVCFGIEIFGDTGYAQRKNDNQYYKIKYFGLQNLNDEKIMGTDFSVCNKIFKRRILESYGIDFPEGMHYEDAEFYFKYMLFCKKAFYINEYLYKYRRRENSTMLMTFSKSCFTIEHLYIVNNMYEYMCNLDLFYKKERLFIKIFKTCLLFALYNTSKINRINVLGLATSYYNKYKFSKKVKNIRFLVALRKMNYRDIEEKDLKFWQKIYYVEKVNMPLLDCARKNLYILGLKIKIKNKYEDILRNLLVIEEDINNLKTEILSLNEKANIQI